MATRRNDLAELRARAKARQRSVNRKIGRLENVKDVRVSGTKYDPRRDIAKIERYNATQLKRYLSELDSFMSRKTQFVPDARRRPIPQSDWTAYKKAERAANAGILGSFDKVKDIHIPSTGMTAGQTTAARTPDHPGAGNPAIHSPKKTTDRKSTNVKDVNAVRKLTKDLQGSKGEAGDRKRERAQRDNFNKITRGWDRKFRKEVRDLTPHQFKILWNFTNFVDTLGTAYAVSQDNILGPSQAAQRRLESNSYAEAKDLLAWAKTL